MALPEETSSHRCWRAATERHLHSRPYHARSVMAVHPSTAVQNRLLASLPADTLAALAPNLDPVVLRLRQQLYDPDTRIEWVYFVESGMVSLVSNMEDGSRAEVGVIGYEDVLGVSLLSGIDTPYVEAMVQLPGKALRMGTSAFLHAVDTNTVFRQLLLRHAEALQAQIMQTAACNGRHDLEQRFARWLLMAHDRAGSKDLPLTQEFMAIMLGVQRTSITAVASILHKAGIIDYRAGKLKLLDRALLEAACCECYDVVCRRYTLLLG